MGTNPASRQIVSTSISLQEHRRRLVACLMRHILAPTEATRAQLPCHGIHRVLVCRNVVTLGDSLMLTPLLRELTCAYPGAEVDILCRCPAGKAVYAGFPQVRRICTLPRHMPGHLLSTLRVLRDVRRRTYDLVIDPDVRSHSGRLLALMARARYTLGFAGGHKRGYCSHAWMASEDFPHKAMAPVWLLRKARGEDVLARDFPQPSLALSVHELDAGWVTLEGILGNGVGGDAHVRPRVAIFANASGDKRLPATWWRDFLAVLDIELPGAVLLEVLPANGVSMLADAYPTYYSSDVRRLAAVLANVDLCVSADSGVMHLAWASGTPTVGFFRHTDVREWGPFGPHASSLALGNVQPAEVAQWTLQWFWLQRERAMEAARGVGT